ncbi:alpha-Mannosidase class II b [Rhipicephalus microplus]|uniref:alpha-Mannosidase class II b n=1 Tax=Rhipicephalus microplus TaxID=6941 RepID=UPI003F6C6995
MMCASRKAKVRALVAACLLVCAALVFFYHYSNDAGELSELHRKRLYGGDHRRREDDSSFNFVHDKAPSSKSSFTWPWAKRETLTAAGDCRALKVRRDVDIYTPDVYPTLNFKPQSRSYWNQTFENRYYETRKQWAKLPLEVIVIPHSHNDPGWLKTFEGYFLSNTAHILNNMVEFLQKHKDFSFLWAEMCFFSRWWRSLENRPHLREAVRHLVHRGQLEMVTGGWVMTDEAAAHYYAMVDQLVEGHQWLRSTLGVVPRAGWSIDPFGHGATVPYLLQAAGIRSTFIQRTHFAWKEFLAARRDLEFLWKTPFPTTYFNDSGVVTHMAPFELYSIKHTCGPNTDVCLKFDFRRLAGEYTESRASQVADHNVATLAELLLGQYGRIGSLFPHNVALVPLGDDFRFDHDIEWEQQYANYRKLFDYINKSKRLHAHVRFGTLSDYFEEVYARMEKGVSREHPFAKLAGDFHSYGDMYAEGKPSYWTGYFTTRPYLKHFSRELEHWLRAAEILYSLARVYLNESGQTDLGRRLDADYVFLVQTRDALGLFQHHDAITGTSKEGVMADYGSRMYNGMKEAMGVIAHAAQYLMLVEQPMVSAAIQSQRPVTSYLYPDVQRPTYDVLPIKLPLSVPEIHGRKIVLYNSHAQTLQEVVRVHVYDPVSRVLDATGEDVLFQLNPVWTDASAVSSVVFELVFIAKLPPLSLSTYTLLVEPGRLTTPKTRVSMFVGDAWSGAGAQSIFNFESPHTKPIVLSTPYVEATFSHETGLLRSIRLRKSGLERRVNVSFNAYRSLEFHSGAYLFEPDASDPFVNVTGRFPIVRVVQGPITSELVSAYADGLTHTFRVYHVDGFLGGGLEMSVVFDLSKRSDYNVEMFMKLDTDVDSGDRTFYTDSSGFQMMKRVTDVRLPVEANYYPVTAAAYLEDELSRINLLVSHAHGAASVQPGSLEVMLDRKLRYDDSRGLGEGVLDVRETQADFWLLLEPMIPENTVKDSEGNKLAGHEDGGKKSQDLPNLSSLAHSLSQRLLYPVVVLATEGQQNRALHPGFSFLHEGYPCSTWMMNLRTVPLEQDFDRPSKSSLLILHRKAGSCRVASLGLPSCELEKTYVSSGTGSQGDAPSSKHASSRPERFRLVKVQSVHRTTLTGVRNGARLPDVNAVDVAPMEIVTLNVTFGP